MPGRTRVLPLAAAIAALALLAPHADSNPDGGPPGDPAETERRIAAAGAPAALRARIHAALERGAAFLASRVGPDGSLAVTVSSTATLPGGPASLEALCALALARVGTQATRAETDRIAARVLPPDGPSSRAALQGAWSTAVLALLAAERGSDPEISAALGDRIASMQDADSGWWGPPAPAAPSGFGVRVMAASGPVVPDADATCWAAFGLAAAEARSGRSWSASWRRLADGTTRRQKPDGGWGFQSTSTASDPGSTAQSISALALALRGKGGAGDPAARAAAAALERAQPVLLEDAADGLWTCARVPGGSIDRSLFLLNVANALSLTGLKQVDDRPWFAPLAEGLLAGQRDDGGWWGPRWFMELGIAPPVSDPASTAIALLVLAGTGAAPTEPPAAPAPAVPAPTWPDPGAAPPSVRVPIAEATEGLDWLESLLADPASRPESTATALRFVGAAFGNLAPGEGGEAPPGEPEWTRRAAQALLKAALIDRESTPAAAAEWRGVRILGARLLAFAGPAVAARYRTGLQTRWFRGREPGLSREEWRAAFGALARVGDEDSLLWIAGDALGTDLDGPRRERGLEALRAIPLFREVPGRLRRRVALRLALSESRGETEDALYSAGSPSYPLARVRWAASRRWVLDALHALCRDPVGGAAAADAAGRPLQTTREFATWIGKRRRIEETPWRDR